MATMLICAVRDSAVDAYGIPIFVRARGEAIRSFMDEVRRKDSTMGQHPEDYTLYLLGEYDLSSGRIAMLSDRPEQLMRGQDCVTNERSE